MSPLSSLALSWTLFRAAESLSGGSFALRMSVSNSSDEGSQGEERRKRGGRFQESANAKSRGMPTGKVANRDASDGQCPICLEALQPIGKKKGEHPGCMQKLKRRFARPGAKEDADLIKLIPATSARKGKLLCGHEFHAECFKEYVNSAYPRKTTCPICRTKIREDQTDAVRAPPPLWRRALPHFLVELVHQIGPPESIGEVMAYLWCFLVTFLVILAQGWYIVYLFTMWAHLFWCGHACWGA